MINKNEFLFVVDEQNNPIDPRPRYLVHEKGLWHRTSGIWIVNKKKQLLCQKRSIKKDRNPGLWESSFGGHLGPNISYIDNALEELSEELGIEPVKSDLLFYKIVQSSEHLDKKFESLYVYQLDREDIDFQIEEEEVDKIQWININDVKKILIDKSNNQWVHNAWDNEMLDFMTQQQQN